MLVTLRQRNFALIWVGGFVSLIGDRAMLTALPFYIYQQTGSTLDTAALFIAYYLPMALFGSIAGVFVDRWNRQRLMIVINLLQAVVLLPLLLVRSSAWFWLIYLVAFVESSAAMFFGPAERAIVPTLVGPEQLVPANALTGLNNNVARLVGPPIGGVLLALFGLGGVVLADSASFLVAGVLIARMSVTHKPSVTAGGDAEGSTDIVSAAVQVWRDWREGLWLVRRDRLLIALFVVITVTSFGGSMIDPLYAPFVGAILHGGPAALGWLSATGAIGGVLAGVVAGRWGSKVQPWKLTAFGTVAVGLLMLATYNQRSLPLVMALNMLMFVPLVAAGVGTETLLQKGVRDAFRGRVFGAINTTIALVGLLSLGLAGIFGEIFGIVPMLSVAAGITFLAGLFALALLPKASVLAEDVDKEVSEPS
ncbi:MAG: MFS transporter [Herpetosiphonaceae bacterium]|nr:MFS transporter [Herpetosiphonaceae bacterium]